MTRRPLKRARSAIARLIINAAQIDNIFSQRDLSDRGPRHDCAIGARESRLEMGYPPEPRRTSKMPGNGLMKEHFPMPNDRERIEFRLQEIARVLCLEQSAFFEAGTTLPDSKRTLEFLALWDAIDNESDRTRVIAFMRSLSSTG